MGKRIYLTDNELDYLRSLLDAQDPHDMGDADEEELSYTAHYEPSRLSIMDKIRKGGEDER